ncbi:MAG: nitronate monooxygenase [Gammaproteobacteria bacterium]|nr:nitronate monooxygenase [Gammaproteobacteria bacterium]MBU0850157.1 nitronate monooxygenase [Gammaproteobacteria bacterium]MBU1528021.1 nitronate monooxygenase [Gammaproteobacteria bacterium]MBU1780872.1 nitronate monooxygenase [Gammaproteobacteria bacterium]MBU2087309.1 nitronate monooxygenase [Gammaproteobacteria bacterium]
MKTRITEMFNIQYPLVCPGMTYVANADLVAATSNAGGLGILAIGHLNPEQTLAEIRKVKSLTSKPFGIGCALIMPGARENLEVALDEKVPVINFSLGSGADVCKRVHEYGGKVIATVVSAKHALSAEKAGVDALLVTGHEAAAHGGSVTSLVLVPAIRQVTNLPIIAAGGFGTGGGLVAALALGADGVAMGTRWAASKESPVHANTKELIVKKEAEDTIYSKNFDSIACRVMTTHNSRKIMSRKFNPVRAMWRACLAAREMNKPLLGILKDVFKMGLEQALTVSFYGAAVLQIRKATLEGNHEQGVQLIGQVQGLVNDVPTVEELTQRVMHEVREALVGLNAQAGK